MISNGLRTLYTQITYNSTDNLNNDFLLFYMKTVIFDITKTLKSQTKDENFGFECCDAPLRFSNHYCMPIEIPEKDVVFQGAKCMNYIRSMVTHDKCKLEEANIVSKYERK